MKNKWRLLSDLHAYMLSLFLPVLIGGDAPTGSVICVPGEAEDFLSA